MMKHTIQICRAQGDYDLLRDFAARANRDQCLAMGLSAEGRRILLDAIERCTWLLAIPAWHEIAASEPLPRQLLN